MTITKSDNSSLKQSINQPQSPNVVNSRVTLTNGNVFLIADKKGN